MLQRRRHCLDFVRRGSKAAGSSARAKLIPEKLRQKDAQFDFKLPTGTTEATTAMRDLLKKTGSEYRRSQGHTDPANSTLNLALSNNTLFTQITNDTKSRMSKRFNEPSKRWQDRVKRIWGNPKELKQLKEDIIDCIKTAHISPHEVYNTITVGDLVTLYEDNVDLHLVVAIADNFSSPTYTFVNNAGEVTFGSKHMIRIRIPGVVPQKYHKVLESFVQLEKKHLDVAPIGISDYISSKSTQALPVELQNTKAPALGINKVENLGDVDNFVVSQAASQLLTNSDINTYLVPVAARQYYSPGLTHASIEAFSELSTVNAKLEVLHRLLQYDENGDTINSPRTISIFEILYYLKHTDFSAIQQPKPNEISHLGKNLLLPFEFEKESHPISTFLALILSLRKQSRLWNIDKNSALFPPISVTIFPIKRVDFVDRVVKYYKHEGGDKQFKKYFNAVTKGQSAEKPLYFDDLIFLLKDYVAGNFTQDLPMEALLVSIIRLLDGKSSMYVYDYSKARAYDIIQQLSTKDQIENPSAWSTSLALPGKNISVMSDLGEEYYRYIDEVGTSVDDFYQEDPLSSIREDIGSTPVYCIDSADAHEIDDGISLHELGDKYVVSVHVANPTSYIKPASILSSIALDRSSTTYFPEGPTMMFPKTIANVSGLGIDSQETRTFVVQYELNKGDLDSYIYQGKFLPPRQLLDSILHQINSSIKIKACTARNFPQNYTYSRVDELLNNESLIEDFMNHKSQDVHFDNLYKLYNLSTILENIRVVVGGGLNLDNNKSDIKVFEVDRANKSMFQATTDGYQLTPQGSTTRIVINPSGERTRVDKSQLLVSSLMIFANYASARYARDNKIEILYRTQDMNLHPEIRKKINEIMANKQDTNSETSNIIAFLTGAKYQSKPLKHESLGVEVYTNFTSPLRRYVDALNHWKFEDYLLKEVESRIPNNKLQFIGNHIQNMAAIRTRVQRSSMKFWEGLFLREYLQMVNNNDIATENRIPFRLVVNSWTSSHASVEVLGHNHTRAQLEMTTALLEELSEGKLRVGEVLDPERVRLLRVDPIEDLLTFGYI